MIALDLGKHFKEQRQQRVNPNKALELLFFIKVLVKVTGVEQEEDFALVEAGAEGEETELDHAGV